METPETDAEIARYPIDSVVGPLVTAAFARSLERRLITLSGIWKAHREMAAKEIAELKSNPRPDNPALPPSYIPYVRLPEEVLAAVETLHVYFETQGMREWQFSHVADRRLVNKLERQIEELRKKKEVND